MTIEAEIKRYRNLANNERCCQKEECFILANWLEELLKYRKAEEQGHLLRLPCKVGDTVYLIESECEGDIYDCSHGSECEGDIYDCSHCCEHCACLNTFVAEVKFDAEWFDCIGKTVFLTREEAESALAEKGGAE